MTEAAGKLAQNRGATVYTLREIEAAIPGLDLITPIEAGFVAYARGQAVVPPVGELLFDDPPGDAHIKYGRIVGDDVFVIKVATGFYGNPALGLPGNSGVMLVFSSTTGMLQAVLMDEGYLTNVRTAVAGAIAAKWLAPSRVDRIAVFGTGLQARMQIEAIAPLVSCSRISAWGRNERALASFRTDMQARGFEVATSQDPGETARRAQVIVTTTAAEVPFLDVRHVAPGTHIVAMGSDTEAKNELTAELIGRADIYVADSLSQCLTRGELHHAVARGTRQADDVVELGRVIADRTLGRTNDEQITIADLTGVAVQDIAIAKAVVAALAPRP